MAVNKPEYPDIQRFGEKLHRLRTRHGMTVRALAAALGYTGYGYIHGLERGRYKPTAEIALRVSLLFKVPIDQLLRDDLDIDAGDADTDETQ